MMSSISRDVMTLQWQTIMAVAFVVDFVSISFLTKIINKKYARKVRFAAPDATHCYALCASMLQKPAKITFL